MRSLSVRAARSNAVYSIGEIITFSVNFAGLATPLPYRILHSRKGVVASGFVDPNGEVRFLADEPGFVEITLEKDDLTAVADAGIEPEKIRPILPLPSDLFAFWDSEIAKQKRKCVRAEKSPVPPPDPENYGAWRKAWPIFNRNAEEPFPEVETFLFSAETLRGNPARGYLAFPKGAKKGSLPALLTLHGAGVADSDFPKTVSAAKNGFLAMDINAHGLSCGEKPEFYQNLRTGALANYFKNGREDGRNSYLASIYLRALRALDYLTQQPEWDGRTLISWGTSQGGCLALVCASLDQRVTKCCAGVPAFCDCADDVFCGWALLNPEDPEDIRRKVKEELQYCTIAHLVGRAKASAYFTVGFLDTTCPPATVYAGYNLYGGPKRIYAAPDSGHGNVPSEIWMDDFTAFMKN